MPLFQEDVKPNVLSPRTHLWMVMVSWHLLKRIGRHCVPIPRPNTHSHTLMCSLEAAGCISGLGHGCAADAVLLLPVHWCSFHQPQKDDRLSQPNLVLIQQPTGLKLRALGSQASHPNHEANTRLTLVKLKKTELNSAQNR